MSNSDEHDRIEAEISRPQAGADPFAGAVRATRMPMVITDPGKADNPIVFVNEAFLKLTGYERDEIIGHNCRFLQGPGTHEADGRRVSRAIQDRVAIELDLLNYKKSGESFWNRLLISPVFDDAGALSYFFASQMDVSIERGRLLELEQRGRDLEIEVAGRTAALKTSDDQLRFALEAGQLGYWTYRPANSSMTLSELCRQHFGLRPGEEITHQELMERITPEDRESRDRALLRAIEDESDYRAEYLVPCADGELHTIEVRGRSHRHADGQGIEMAGVSRDITEQKRTEETRSVLMRELNHRIKNIMATVQSIVQQTLRQAKTPEQALPEITARLLSMSAAQDALVYENGREGTLTDVVEGTLKPFRDSYQQRLQVSGPDILVPSQTVVSLSMALHELATNAIKYGALSNDDGRVALSWGMVPQSTHQEFWLRWQETGGPTVTPPASRGFGTRMIERILAANTNGSASLEFNPEGVCFTMSAPIRADIKAP